jgi:hypothetical protein
MFSSIGNGARSSSSTAYLRPASDRSNLDIVVNTQATKLINTGDVNSVPSFNSILVAQSPGCQSDVLYSNSVGLILYRYSTDIHAFRQARDRSIGGGDWNTGTVAALRHR